MSVRAGLVRVGRQEKALATGVEDLVFTKKQLPRWNDRGWEKKEIKKKKGNHTHAAGMALFTSVKSCFSNVRMKLKGSSTQK